MKKLVFFVKGLLWVLLAIVTIPIPLVPQKYFFGIAFGYFSQCIPVLQTWLSKQQWITRHIENWQRDRSVSIGLKAANISLLWTLQLFAIFFIFPENTLIQWLLVGGGLIETIATLSLRTAR